MRSKKEIKQSLIRVLILPAGLLIVLTTRSESQSKRISLFNGKDLAGWETQGLGNWSVDGGVLVGTKPKSQPDWAHLVSKRAFTDSYYRLKYKIDSGNSGAYVRSSLGGTFGVNGIQVEMGGNEGSMMTVTKTDWKWMLGNPVATPQLLLGQWHELSIEVKGQNISTWVDGKLMQHAQAIDTTLLPKAGALALQMHAGAYQNTMSFKDIEVFTPTLITGCMDARYKEFNPLANDSSVIACKTMATGLVNRRDGATPYYHETKKHQGWNLQGRQFKGKGAEKSVKTHSHLVFFPKNILWH